MTVFGKIDPIMQTDNRFFDDLAKLATGAAGALTSVRSEAEGTFKAWLDRRLGAMDLVTREEFDAVREMAANARKENERLAEKVAKLEALITKADTKVEAGAPAKAAKTAASKSARPTKAAPKKAPAPKTGD